MKLQYLPAMDGDIQTVFAQCCDLVETYEDLSDIDYPKVKAWLYRKIEANISSYTRIIYNGETVAYYRLIHHSGDTGLDDFYVLPQYRGMGIGSAILRKCLEETEKPVYLYVFTGNTRAVKLYEKFGFSVSEQVSKTRCIMRYRT